MSFINEMGPPPLPMQHVPVDLELQQEIAEDAAAADGLVRSLDDPEVEQAIASLRRSKPV